MLMILVAGGIYHPLYPASPLEAEITVAPFHLDRSPVTNAAYLAFVQQHSEWQRGQIPHFMADTGYLSTWAGPQNLGTVIQAEGPVTGVSWFAARAFCEARGARLPTEAEWEVAAMASETAPDATKDAAFSAQILNWYSRPSPNPLPKVAQSKPNYWGIYDLHGLIWEWVEDFNSSLVSADNRDDKDGDRLRFCGNGGSGAASKEDYAAFMRVAFRSSLEATYAVNNLGFRCARDQ